MNATEFEFRHRRWFIIGIFVIAFLAPGFPRRMSAERIASLIGAGRWPDGSREWHLALKSVLAAGALLVGLGACARTWGSAYLQSTVVRDASPRSERLVADGPYRYVRNPLYFGNVLMALGIGIMATPLGWLVLVMGMIFFVARLIGLEESRLLQAHGDSFRLYCAAVPKLLPAVQPRLPSGPTKPRWGQAVLGEFGMWWFLLAMAAFTRTLNIKWFYWILAVGVGASLTIRFMAKTRKRASP